MNFQNESALTDITFSIGALADSLYEYLPKMYILLSGRGAESSSYEAMYRRATNAIAQHVLFRPMLPDGDDILFPGTAYARDGGVELDPEGQHLSCFSGNVRRRWKDIRHPRACSARRAPCTRLRLGLSIFRHGHHARDLRAAGLQVKVPTGLRMGRRKMAKAWEFQAATRLQQRSGLAISSSARGRREFVHPLPDHWARGTEGIRPGSCSAASWMPRKHRMGTLPLRMSRPEGKQKKRIRWRVRLLL